jgi:ribosome biogenesis GTPase
MKQLTTNGKILEGVGGRYTVEITATEAEFHHTRIPCQAKGAFRHENITPLPGDNVEILMSVPESGEEASISSVITDIKERKNALIRPPMANLDILFVLFASANPEPMPDTIDKLLLIAEHHGITPVIVITKSELSPLRAAELEATYRLTPYPIFILSAVTGDGVKEFRDFVYRILPGKTAAFAGASGIGKSTLINTLFPHLSLETAEISHKNQRGRHTTRKVSLFPLSDLETESGTRTYLADTPGFSMLDFVRFDFFSVEELPYTFREFVPQIGRCRYTKCTHTKEEGCAILAAVAEKQIPKSRHTSYLEMHDALKDKKEWMKE